MIDAAQDAQATLPHDESHSLRTLHIKVTNVPGIMNRLCSLMRRKRFDLSEVSVSFDEEEHAHIVFVVDSSKSDISQVMAQLRKLHDVLSVEDSTSKQDHFFNTFYVTANSEDDFAPLARDTVEVLKRDDHIVGIFLVSIDESPAFAHLLKTQGLHFRRRIVTLL